MRRATLSSGRTVIRQSLVVAVVNVTAFIWGFAIVVANQDSPKPERGEQIVNAACTTCHDLRPIETQALDEAGWTKEVKSMIEQGADVKADDVPIVVEFLTRLHGPLPDGPGKDILLNVCTRCHDLQRVRRERNGAEGWLEILDAMLNEGAPLPEKDLPVLLRYLARNFGPSPVPLFLIAATTALSPSAAVAVSQVTAPPSLVIGFEPSPLPVTDAMLELAGVGVDDVVYDLGSGDGRIVIRAAQKYGARGVGVELQPGLVQASRQAALQAGVADRVTFVEADLFRADISDATVVTLYLWPSANDRLETKLRRELRPGTRIVSHGFGIGSWNPTARVRAQNGRDLMLWTVPRRPARTPDVAFVPTPQPVADQMLRLAAVRSNDVVFDLGSGDGRIVILAAEKYGARGVGIELDPELVERSRQVAQQGEAGDRVSFIEGDLFTANISEATIVTLCLSADVNARLEAKLRQLRPGTRIVSRQFRIGRWIPDETVHATDKSVLFLWTVRPQ